MEPPLLLLLKTTRSPGDLDRMTSELTADLGRQTGLRAARPASAPREGQRGLDPLIGQILLTLVGGAGAGTALVTCLRAYVQRDRNLTFTLRRPDGAELEFSATHLKQKESDAAFRALQSFVSGIVPPAEAEECRSE